MAEKRGHQNKKKKRKAGKVFAIILLELFVLALIFGGYYIFTNWQDKLPWITGNQDNLTKEQQEAQTEQEQLRKGEEERKELIARADQLTLDYDYDGAIELIKGYQGPEGNYQVYTSLVKEIERLETEQSSLSLYGGVYNSVYEISHLYFNTLIADTARAFDGDSNSTSYNKYNITVSEFEKILQTLYDQNYVLIRMSDIAVLETKEDGTTGYVPKKFYLKEGKKPIILSEDDVAYYEYMKNDGFASRLVLDAEGKPSCEMTLSDGTISTGDFDIVPILDKFVSEHPDFSYRGAKGLLTLTGYEGVFGYRTNDPTSDTYASDCEAAKAVAEALKSDGWEFACHSWGHKDMQAGNLALLKSDTERWLKEVEPLVGPTDIYAFPFGNDIETGSGIYSGEKYQFLKESGFNIFLGVYKEPWLHIKKNYVRMTRRPIDGQVFIEYPERLADLFQVEDIIYPSRPDKNW